MKNTIVVLADLGCLKAYRVEKPLMNHSPRLELLEEFNNVAPHTRLTETVSDASGRFPRTGSGGGMSDGERHNIGLEQRRRLVKALGERVTDLIRSTGAEACYLAASRAIHNQLMDEICPEARKLILRNVHADLTKVDKQELLSHFPDGA
jgi:hypothetical protein